jgi:hypothetical protein
MTRGLTDETPIPLKWAAGIVIAMGAALSSALLVGMWVSTVDSNAKTTEDKVRLFEEKEIRVERYMRSIDSRLSNIEGRLGVESKKTE